MDPTALGVHGGFPYIAGVSGRFKYLGFRDSRRIVNQRGVDLQLTSKIDAAPHEDFHPLTPLRAAAGRAS
jgi:hypothetical protein